MRLQILLQLRPEDQQVDSYTSLAYTKHVEFQWDPVKNKANIERHGLSFEEASDLFKFSGHLILEEYDLEHSFNEDRIISIGPIARGVVVVVSVERNDGDVIRFISARFATTTEQERYSDLVAETPDE